MPSRSELVPKRLRKHGVPTYTYRNNIVFMYSSQAISLYFSISKNKISFIYEPPPIFKSFKNHEKLRSFDFSLQMS